jgi:hypothetical protein
MKNHWDSNENKIGIQFRIPILEYPKDMEKGWKE